MSYMGIRTRKDEWAAKLGRAATEKAARESAERVVIRWNNELAAGRDMWWSPTIRAAVIAGMPWLDVHCPGCRTSRALDIRTVDRHPLASVGSLVLGLRCSWCRGWAPNANGQLRGSFGFSGSKSRIWGDGLLPHLHRWGPRRYLSTACGASSRSRGRARNADAPKKEAR